VTRANADTTFWNKPTLPHILRLGEGKQSGFLEGNVELPVDGLWLVKLEFFLPKPDQLWANVVKGVSTKVASGEREAHTTAKIQEQQAAGAKSVLLQKNAVAGSSAGTARLHAAQTIECRLNGAVHNLSAVGMVAGQKREMLMVVRGQELRYRFDFLSAHGQVYVEGDGDGPGWPFYSRGSETEFHYSGRAHVGLQVA
jgi:hypothetical protein